MVTTSVLLLGLGLVLLVQAQDCPSPVAGPNMNLKGSDILLQTFPDGTSVTFGCDVGYQPAGGSAVSTCKAGTWTPVRLLCERKNCGSAGEIPNGYIDYPEDTLFGDKLVSHCNPGYNLVGNREVFCGDGGWAGRLPTCEVITCDPPPNKVTNGSYSPRKEYYTYREVIEYSCQNQYTLHGSKFLTCSENGNFSPEPPKCVGVSCKDPVIENAEWVTGSRPPHRHMATVTYKCKAGYEMVGEPTLTCVINSTWSPGFPVCKLKAVTLKPTTTTTTTAAAATTPKKTGPTEGGAPGGAGDTFTTLGIPILVVVGLVAALIGCCIGVWMYNRKKTGSHWGFTDKEAAKNGEDIPL